MIQESSSDPFSRTIRLPGSLHLPAAPSLAATLLSVRGHQVTLDASSVERVGAQCIQVLVSAQNLWAQDGLAFTVSNPSPAFLEALGTLGISISKIGEQEPER
jgi:chemotaxis protein CheX